MYVFRYKMGKKTASLKAESQGPSRQDRIDEIIRQQELASARNKNLMIAFVVFGLFSAVGYQYMLQSVVAAGRGGGRQAIEGVSQDQNGFTLMHKAAEKSVEAVKELGEEGKKAINVPDNWNETPIAKAAKKGRHTTVKYLLEQGADPNVISTEVRSPLYHALFEAQGKDTAKVLMDGGADVNVTCRDGRSLLHVAVEKADLEVAEFLLTHKIDVDRQDRSTGKNALHLAAGSKDEKMADLVKMILKAGGEINAQSEGGDGFTALHEAASIGNTGVVRVLLDAGADTDVKDGMLKRTALALATKRGHEEVVTLLKKVHQVSK